MKTILVDAVNAFVIKEHGVFKEMYVLLETYPNRKIVLTGANDEEAKKFQLEKVPYEIFTMKHNPEKTEPKYYELMLAKFNLNKKEVVYFEHNIEAVESAKFSGIITYHYNKDKQDLKALKNFLDNNL